MNISILEGKILKEIKKIEDKQLNFYCEDGKVYRMYHEQECCEAVWLEDICGDLDDLIDSKIISAKEETQHSPKKTDEYNCCSSWTFYILRTMKGTVTLRWYGTSNGCYSQKADIELITNEKKQERK